MHAGDLKTSQQRERFQELVLRLGLGEAREFAAISSGLEFALEAGAACDNFPAMSTLLSRITIDPNLCHGKPCVRGLRYPVTTLLEYLAGGDTMEGLLEEFPDLERDDLLACIEFAAQSLKLKSGHLEVA